MVRKLAALDDEEADLLRRLAEGDLTPEEEAEIRARLVAISAEREGLQSQLMQAELANIDGKLAALDSKLSALDDEEADLLRRLAAGDLSPEDEVEVRARLAAIVAEREGLLEQRAGLLQKRADVQEAAGEGGALPEDDSGWKEFGGIKFGGFSPFEGYLYSACCPAAAQGSSASNARVRSGMNPLNSSQLLSTALHESYEARLPPPLRQKHQHQQTEGLLQAKRKELASSRNFGERTQYEGDEALGATFSPTMSKKSKRLRKGMPPLSDRMVEKDRLQKSQDDRPQERQRERRRHWKAERDGAVSAPPVLVRNPGFNVRSSRKKLPPIALEASLPTWIGRGLVPSPQVVSLVRLKVAPPSVRDRSAFAGERRQPARGGKPRRALHENTGPKVSVWE